MNFKEIFKDLKEEKGVSLTEIAKNTGIPVTTLSNYINRGSIPRSDQLSALSDFFGVTVDYLIGNEEITSFGQEKRDLELSKEELDLIKFYRAIDKPSKLAIFTTAKSFYNQLPKEKRISDSI